jgi:chemotaxis signal transduction protein
MNSDALTTALPSSLLNEAALAKNLIAALTKLQHRAVDKELLDDSVPLAADAKPESFFGFSIGVYHFMVAASCFCEVFVDTAIASIPNAPSSLVGLSNVRGVLIPIYQLHSAWAFEQPKKSIIFSVGRGESAVGILIDSLPISLAVLASQRHATSKHEHALSQQIVPSNFVESNLVDAHYCINQCHWLKLNGVELGAQLLAMAKQPHKSHAYLSAGHEPAYS